MRTQTDAHGRFELRLDGVLPPEPVSAAIDLGRDVSAPVAIPIRIVADATGNPVQSVQLAWSQRREDGSMFRGETWILSSAPNPVVPLPKGRITLTLDATALGFTRLVLEDFEVTDTTARTPQTIRLHKPR